MKVDYIVLDPVGQAVVMWRESKHRLHKLTLCSTARLCRTLNDLGWSSEIELPDRFESLIRFYPPFH